jgi:acyl-CoA synthetase (NDP forming)
MNALRDAKKSEIRTYLASSVSTANITLLLEKALAKEYVTEVNTLLNDSTKTDLYNLSSTIKDKIRQDTTLI